MLVGKGVKAGKNKTKPTKKKRDSEKIGGEVKALLEDLVTRGLLDEALWGERKDIRKGDFIAAKEKKQQREMEYMKMVHEFDYVIDESIYDTTEWTLFLLQHLLNIDYKAPKIQPEIINNPVVEKTNRLSFLSTTLSDIREKIVADMNVPVPQTEEDNEEKSAFFITDENEQYNPTEDKSTDAAQRRLYRHYIPEYNLLSHDVVFTIFWGEMVALNNTVLKLLQDFNSYGNAAADGKVLSSVTTIASTSKHEGTSRVTVNKSFRRGAEDILNRLKYKQADSGIHAATSGDAAGESGAVVDDDTVTTPIGADVVTEAGSTSAACSNPLDEVVNEGQASTQGTANRPVSAVQSLGMEIIESKADLERVMARSRWRELTKWVRDEAAIQKTSGKSSRVTSPPPKHLNELLDRVQKQQIPMTHIWSESLSSQAPVAAAPVSATPVSAVPAPKTDAENGPINIVIPAVEPDNEADFLSSIDRNIRKKPLKREGIPVRHVLAMNTRKLEYTNYFPETLVKEMVTYDEIVSSLCVLQSTDASSAGIDCSVIGDSSEDRSYKLMDRYGRVDAIALSGTIDDRIEKSRAFHIHIAQSFASQDSEDDSSPEDDADNNEDAENVDENVDRATEAGASTPSRPSRPYTSDQDGVSDHSSNRYSRLNYEEADGQYRKRVVSQRIVDLELKPVASAIPQIRWNESNTRIICERNKTGRQPKVQRVLIRYPIRNFGQEFEEVIYDPQTYLLHVFSTRNGAVVSHNIVHISSVYVTRSLFYDMVTIRTNSPLLNTNVSSNGYLGTIRADYWNLLINEIHYSINGRANQDTDRVKDIREKWKGAPARDTLYRDSQNLMQARLVDAELSVATDGMEKSKRGLVSTFGEDVDEEEKWPVGYAQPVPDKTVFALKVDKKAFNTGMSQPSFVDESGEGITDGTNSVSAISNALVDGLTADDTKTVKKITTLTMPLATSDYSRAGEISKSQRNKFVPQLPASHNSSSKAKSPISNRSKYTQKQFGVAENVFALQGTAPVYHEYPRSSPVDIRTPRKKQYVIATKPLNSKATSIAIAESVKSVSTGLMAATSTLFTPVQLQHDSLDTLSHYSLQKSIKVSPPTLPIDSNLGDHLLLLIESRTVYQNYFCEKFQILDVVCDPCITFHDARDLLADSPLSYDIICISLSDLMACHDITKTLKDLNPGRIYHVVVYGAFGTMPNIEETLGLLQELGVTDLLEEPYSLLDMKKLMQKLRDH